MRAGLAYHLENSKMNDPNDCLILPSTRLANLGDILNLQAVLALQNFGRRKEFSILSLSYGCSLSDSSKKVYMALCALFVRFFWYLYRFLNPFQGECVNRFVFTSVEDEKTIV